MTGLTGAKPKDNRAAIVCHLEMDRWSNEVLAAPGVSSETARAG